MDKLARKKTFSKVLVAIHESSKSADKAVDYATRIAKDYNAILVVLYVVRTQANLDTVSLPSHVIDFKRQAQAYLTKISEKIHKHSDTEDIVKVKTEIIASIKIADAIVDYAKDKHIDLIVVGPRGRSKLKSLVLGSVTSDVVRLANCPVLTVR
ncbi:MAG: universal stress protein [Thaumarchaeota archaeon]|jgi:nucleotide-binding universal stress UspA family protein|nr:MAG: universal stress protein [Nitrososphaerota archaeon]